MLTIVLLLLALLLPLPAVAAPVAGTCTVTGMVMIAHGAIDRDFDIGPPASFTFPVTIDAATGAFAFDRTGWPDRYAFSTVGPIMTYVTLPQNTIMGTIDAAGNVSLPDFDFTVAVDTICMPEECVLEARTTLATGFGVTFLSGAPYATRGTPVDLQTGSLQLQGSVPWPEGPGGGSVTGLGLACTLAPIPSGLPKAPTLTPPRGKIKIGPTLPDAAPPDGKVVGDAVTLKATLKRGAVTVDPSNDTWVQLTDAMGHEVALLYVAKGSLQTKGKTYSVTDTDGSSIRVVSGRKKNVHVLASLGGRLILRGTKKGVVATLQEAGLDLASLTAAGHVTIQIGNQIASASIKVTGTGAKRKIH